MVFWNLKSINKIIFRLNRFGCLFYCWERNECWSNSAPKPVIILQLYCLASRYWDTWRKYYGRYLHSQEIWEILIYLQSTYCKGSNWSNIQNAFVSHPQNKLNFRHPIYVIFHITFNSFLFWYDALQASETTLVSKHWRSKNTPWVENFLD